MRGLYWTPEQRQELEGKLNQTNDAALFRRLVALLEVDEGCSISQVARQLRVSRRSIHRWMERFASQRRVQALEHQPGQGRPLKWNKDCESLIESALAQPPVQMGYRANGWTLPLLQAFLSDYLPEQKVSISSLRRRLREMGYVWKRFRYSLVPDPEEEKKTRNPGQDSLFACSMRAFSPR